MDLKQSITLPFAVHTAKFGYDWSSIPPGMSREAVDLHYRMAMSRRPEFMEIGDVVSGVFVHGGWVIAFYVQIAKDWDSNGRDAEYGAFAFVPQSAAAAIDFDSLLSMREFREPMRNPPSLISYVGPRSCSADTELARAVTRSLCRGEIVDFVEYGYVGAAIAAVGTMCSSWFFCSVKTAGGVSRQAKVLQESRECGRVVPPPIVAAEVKRKRDWSAALIWLVAAGLVVLALVTAFRG